MAYYQKQLRINQNFPDSANFILDQIWPGLGQHGQNKSTKPREGATEPIDPGEKMISS